MYLRLYGWMVTFSIWTIIKIKDYIAILASSKKRGFSYINKSFKTKLHKKIMSPFLTLARVLHKIIAKKTKKLEYTLKN